MNVIRRRGWELPERAATPEHLFFDRRAFLAATGAVLAAPTLAAAQRAADLPDPSAGLYPVKRNEKFVLDRPVTDEAINTTYNNFYEFGSSKTISRAAQALKLRPWTVKIDGMVGKPIEIGLDDLLAKMPLEERLYRHRCVEAWSMAIPWSGFPMAKLVELAQPLSSAKYVKMETFLDRDVASGQRASWYPWPYVEGLTMAEATNELAFLVPGPTASRCRSRRARHFVLRCRGSTVSSRSNRSRISRSQTSDQEVSGRHCRLPSMASGPTSIRRCRICGGARRAKS
jgi:methionine sulfoxide reductase catalytic subunit